MILHTTLQKNGCTAPYSSGDAYISACALLLAAMAKGQSRLYHFSDSVACNNLCGYLLHAGIHMERQDNVLIVHGIGLQAFRENILKKAAEKIYTLFALLEYSESITDFSEECLKPLLKSAVDKMEKTITTAKNKQFKEPIYVFTKKDRLSRFTWEYFYLKAALLFFTLLESPKTTNKKTKIKKMENHKICITEDLFFCDHTERLFAYFGIGLESWGSGGRRISLFPALQDFPARDLCIPQAAGSIALPLLQTVFSDGGEFIAKNVLWNSKRAGFFYTLKTMGANITITKPSWCAFEPVATICVKGGKELQGVVVPEALSASIFEEMPLLVAAAAFAKGKTTFYGWSGSAESMQGLLTHYMQAPEAYSMPASDILEVTGMGNEIKAQEYWQSLGGNNNEPKKSNCH